MSFTSVPLTCSAMVRASSVMLSKASEQSSSRIARVSLKSRASSMMAASMSEGSAGDPPIRHANWFAVIVPSSSILASHLLLTRVSTAFWSASRRVTGRIRRASFGMELMAPICNISGKFPSRMLFATGRRAVRIWSGA